MRFRGKFQEAEVINKNKRKYPFGVLDENVQRLQNVIKGRGLVGQLDHPSDSIIHFQEASHIITKLYWNGNVLMGEGEILTTPHGKVLKALLNDGVRVGISSRGVGNGKVDGNGVLIIGESYKLITFDAVADPSCHSAFQERVKEHTDNFNDKINKTHIYTQKEALIAALGGVIKDHTARIRAKL
jgi:hypothetical protein